MPPTVASRAPWGRLPGHGATPAPDWLTSDDQVLDLLMELVDAVAGGQRLVVVGSSWGGYHARGLANRLADRIDGMLLTVPVVSPGQGRTDVPLHKVLVTDPAAIADVGYRDGWSLLDHMPRATYLVLDRAGHALEREQSALFTALASEWLDRVEEFVRFASDAAPKRP